MRRPGAWAAAVALAAILSVFSVGVAHAADSIYWLNFKGKTISHANLAGGGGGELPTPGTALGEPIGTAIDPASGRIYWANRSDSTIRFANLDGSGGGTLDTTGASVLAPEGVTIDPATHRIYWANSGNNTIAFANLSGGGGGKLDTTGAIVALPADPVVDPRTNRIYWIDSNVNNAKIFYASLGGGGGGQVNTGLTPLASPEGLAIDPSTDRLYWANTGGESIGFAGLNGGASGTLDTGGEIPDEPFGLAIDPAADRIYWADVGNEAISFASLSGHSAHGKIDTTGATPNVPLFPALLEAPHPAVPAVHPDIKGPPPGVGATLSCQASWAADLVESFLFQAPQTVSYQWLLNGAPLAGATASSLKADRLGEYRCQASASNFAGSATQTTPPVEIVATLKLGKARVNPRNGTAVLPVTVGGAGKLQLSGAGLVGRRRSVSSRTVKLSIKAKGKAKRALQATGKARVRARITFTPLGAKPLRRTIAIGLRLRRR